MIVKDLVNECSEEIVLGILGAQIPHKGKTAQEMIHGYANILAKMRNIEPEETENVLLASSGCLGGIYGRPIDEIALFPLNDIRENFRLNEEWDAIVDAETYENLPQDAADLKSEYSGLVRDCMNEGNWAEVLGYLLDEENVKEYGKENILAKILYEIAVWGFDEDEIREELQELDDEPDEMTFSPDDDLETMEEGEIKIGFLPPEATKAEIVTMSVKTFGRICDLEWYRVLRGYYRRHFCG